MYVPTPSKTCNVLVLLEAESSQNLGSYPTIIDIFLSSYYDHNCDLILFLIEAIWQDILYVGMLM